MKRNFITCIIKKRALLMLVGALIMCAVGKNCLADSSVKKNKIIDKNIEMNEEIYPIKRAMFGNKKIATSGVHYTREKRGTFSIKMKKGYILKKIQLGVKKKGKKIVYKKIKNKSKIALGKLYELYSGSAVIKITYICSDSRKKKYIYFHIYRI